MYTELFAILINHAYRLNLQIRPEKIITSNFEAALRKTIADERIISVTAGSAEYIFSSLSWYMVATYLLYNIIAGIDVNTVGKSLAFR